MKINNLNTDKEISQTSQTLESITEKFEMLRTKLHEFTDGDGNLSDNEEMLEISQKLDELHLEYIRMVQAQKEELG